MGLFSTTSSGVSQAVTAATKSKGLWKSAITNVVELQKIQKTATNIAKNSDDVLNALKSTTKSADEVAALRKNLTSSLNEIKTIDDMSEVAKVSKSSSLSLLDSLTKWKNANPKAAAAMTKAGLGLLGLGTLMLLTGESNPFTALGVATGETLGGVAEGVGTGVSSFFDALGLGTTGMYVASGVSVCLCCLMILLLLFIK